MNRKVYYFPNCTLQHKKNILNKMWYNGYCKAIKFEKIDHIESLSREPYFSTYETFTSLVDDRTEFHLYMEDDCYKILVVLLHSTESYFMWIETNDEYKKLIFENEKIIHNFFKDQL